MKRIFSVLMSIVIVLSCVVFIMPPNIVLAANNADDIVSIARGELGSTNYSKYYGGNKGAWCADFVSWCAQQAGVDSIAKSSSCYNMYIGMKNNGCQEVSSPQKGDIVFFYCTKCSSTAGKWCHVGIMEDSKYSIEGNRWSNGVSKVERGNSYSHNGDLGYKHRDGIVRKYLRPKYSVPNPPTYSNFWIDGNFYDLSETITFNVTASGADRFAIGIDKIGGARVVTEGCGSTYSISANRLGTGNYSAYMSVANSAGYVDTYRVGFIVAEKNKYLDIGNNLIANIIKVDSWSHVVNKNSNACIGNEVGNANEYWFFQRQDDGSYTIRSMEDGKYLDVSEAGNRDGLNVYCYDYTGADNQRWFIKQGTNGLILVPKCAINSCLDISNGGSAVDTNAQLWTQAGVAAQEFSIYNHPEVPDFIRCGDNFIANIIKVDTWSSMVNNNSNAEIGKEEGNANEYYEFTRQSDGAYIIKSLEDGKYLDVSDGGNKNGQNVGFSDYTGENNQRWYIKNGSSGKILIPKNATGSCLDISNNGSAVGTNAQIWAQAGVAAQEFSIYTQSKIPNFINFGDDFYANIIKASTWSTLVNKNPNLEVGGEGEAEGSDIWHFRRMKDGTYTIQSLFDGKYLDVEKFSDQKGANVYCYDYTGDSNQRWYLTLGKNGKVLIPKNATGLCLDVSNDGSDAGTNAQLWEPNGTTAQEFNVYKEDTIKLGTANVTLSNNNYIYDGKEKKPDVTVKYGYATLQQGTDYTVEYSNNVKAGTATVTIKGTGIYSGTVSKNFEIKEALYTVYGYQVAIKGNFDLKYYIDLSKEAANDTDAYIEFKIGDRVQKVKQRETSNGHYVYTCEVPVAQIGDKVTATLHYKDKSYALTQYSVKDYLNTIVQNKDKKEEYGKAADIASAILNYGARAQLYFGYKTDSLVNSALPDAEIKKVDSILAQDIKKAITNKENGVLENNDFKYYGDSLVCKSDTGMKLYFENKNSLSLKEIEKKYDISVKDCKKQVSKSINGNMICITINDLNATELDDNFVVQITNKQNSSQSMSVSTSPYIYIKKSMDSGNEKLINLSKAMYWYSQKAMEYSATENR